MSLAACNVGKTCFPGTVCHVKVFIENIFVGKILFYNNNNSSGCSGDTCYHFRIRKEYNVTKERDDIGSRDSHFYYGYVFFRLDSIRD